MRKKLQLIDYYILIPYLLLCGVGVVMVYSASSNLVGQNPLSYLVKQISWTIVGLILAAFVYAMKLKVLRNRRLIMLALIVVFLMLGYLIFFGHSVNGAAAWINIGPINIQPGEFAKLVLIWYFAYILSRRERRMVESQLSEVIRALVGPIIIAAVMMWMVLVSPDMGGMAILLSIAIMLILTSGLSYRIGLTLIALLGTSVGAVFYFLTHHIIKSLENNYQYQRILSFINPFELANKGGKQLVNSYYAINNGGWFGVGLGNSIQKRGYLPEPNTDFIISITAEELGFVMVALLIFLIFFLAARIILVGVRSKDPFSALLCIGIGTMIVVQTSFNLGGVCGMLPITGVTFPFISYGGSSMLVLALSMGVALNISATEKKTSLVKNK
ncbi:cell division protein FtsW [Loigolactobacillus backii]|uniref:FtsW/RodA/SpoVE family cell cycle protein n=1 Tax=Loigolactobacillus backii TaxID=375175 RepID=UPI0007F154A2|nr:FtsW/RodA/SpoVE family cell cycle protein [Loigolactobacillus backii]ANK59710.1 cell division protein FtsW [Loigolactobacillus backii]ANK64706.1 cell division protein FtsW [Loigolactobacillus backii]ANK66845.1 cell division protein FtsW [Loigolactobacillus backii]OLF70559.1 cell division protein FtsW [Loigolactobacillus backii]PIO87554.1 cell division protein FtsW [Loigolactobacillus backii]